MAVMKTWGIQKEVLPCPMERARFEALKFMSEERNVGQRTIP